MKNTPENKAKFFAQYLGQKVLIDSYGTPFVLTASHLKDTNEGAMRFFLRLKDPSQITDEDAKELALFYFREDPPMWDESQYIKAGKKISSDFTSKNYISKSWKDWKNLRERTDEVFSFLRSKDYALPSMGTSVEQQIEWGWVSLEGKADKSPVHYPEPGTDNINIID